MGSDTFDWLSQSTVLSVLAWALVCLSVTLVVIGGSPTISRRLEHGWREYLRWIGHMRDRFFIDAPADHIARALVVGGFAVGGLWWFILGDGPIDAVIGTAVGLALPMLVVRAMWHQRIKSIRENIETALQLMASRWRNSADVGKAFEAVVEHLEGPISQEAELVVRELRVGTPAHEALGGLEQRAPIRPVQLTCVGIRQALPLGGNIAEVLEQIAAAVRESNRLEMFVDSKTTEGRTQAWVMGALPLAAAYGLHKLDPTLIEPLFHSTTGKWILAAAVLLDLIGLLLILKITDIKV